jgi:hypothetical protein
MPRRSKVEQLPADMKAWLDQALVQNNFSQYELLSAELKKRGCEISKTGLHRYGQEFEERLKTLRMVTELARAVAELGKASVAQKRWQMEARKQALEEAAKEAGIAAKSVGLTDDAVEQIKRRILGIAE